MKLAQISFLAIGLMSSGAMAQAASPATNPPAPASPTNATPAEAKPAEPPDKEQYSLALAIYYAQGVSNDMARTKFGLDAKVDLDLPLFVQTFSNVIAGLPTTTNMEELRKILSQEEAYQTNRIQEEIKKLTALALTNKVQGERFMDSVAGMPGVTKLASGVVYRVVKEGDGDKPLSVDVATLSFRVTQVDGAEVWKVEHTPVLASNQLLPPGIREVLTLMKAGSHWTVYLPYPQAYGEKPGIADPRHGFKVGPFSALTFDLEVESVQHRPAGPMMMPPGASAVPTAVPVSPPVTSSSIVRVPSAEEMSRGEKPRVLTEAEMEAAKLEAARAAQTNLVGPPRPR